VGIAEAVISSLGQERTKLRSGDRPKSIGRVVRK